MSTAVDQTEFVFAKADAQRSATLIQLGCVTAAIVCIALAALLQEPINQKRRDLQLVLQSDLYKELPPKYAWVSAAGGTFRGIAADVLWMRADKLKQEGKYYELHQLSKWICTLQPRFATVWSFNAWNMSYNISVATHTARERWQWVYNGIRLLRDEGIPNNEKVVPLYHQMAWTWFHKVGDRLDDYHMTYKRQWAATMETLLGSPPVSEGDQAKIDWLKPVVDAPRSLEALTVASPGVKKLVDQLSSIGVDVNATTSAQQIQHPLETTFFKPYTAWQIEKRFSRLRKGSKAVDESMARAWAFFDGAPDADLQPLLAYLRSKVLREQYKMDPKFMHELTGKLGTAAPIPIDWRTPWSQAIYWAMYGTQKGREAKSVKDFDLLNTDRILLFSLGALSRQGNYIFRVNLDQPDASFLDVSPDFRYVEAIHQMCLKLGKLYAEPGEKVENTAGEMLRDFHINTLHSNIVGLHLAGHDEQARRYFEYLAANYKDQFTGETKEMYLGSFRDFIQQQIKDMAGNMQEAILLMHSLLYRAYMSLGEGAGDEYADKTRAAYEVYDSYQADRRDDPQGRRTLPPWNQIRADALGRFVTDVEVPLLLRFVVWDRENATEVKQRCYDDVRKVLDEWYAKTDLDVAKAFPEPPGMAEWRAAHPVEKPEEVSQKANEERRKKDAEKANK